MKTNNPNPEPLGSGKEGRKTLPLPRLLCVSIIFQNINKIRNLLNPRTFKE